MHNIVKIVTIIFLLSTYSIADKVPEDLIGVLDKPLEKVDGYQVIFDYEKYPHERELAYKYFHEEYKDNKTFKDIKLEDIGIDLYDIDDDGEKEIFAYVNFGDRCPRAGCPFAVLKKLGKNNFKVIGWALEGESCLMLEKNIEVSGMPIILENKTNGFHDIIFDKNYIWKWKGNRYDFLK